MRKTEEIQYEWARVWVERRRKESEWYAHNTTKMKMQLRERGTTVCVNGFVRALCSVCNTIYLLWPFSFLENYSCHCLYAPCCLFFLFLLFSFPFHLKRCLHTAHPHRYECYNIYSFTKEWTNERKKTRSAHSVRDMRWWRWCSTVKNNLGTPTSVYLPLIDSYKYPSHCINVVSPIFASNWIISTQNKLFKVTTEVDVKIRSKNRIWYSTAVHSNECAEIVGWEINKVNLNLCCFVSLSSSSSEEKTFDKQRNSLRLSITHETISVDFSLTSHRFAHKFLFCLFHLRNWNLIFWFIFNLHFPFVLFYLDFISVFGRVLVPSDDSAFYIFE